MSAIKLQGNASGAGTQTLQAAATAGTPTITLPDATGTLLISGGDIGTPSAGTVTNLTGTASININGTVGATTANTGAFTTLSASSTVSGAGFSTYLASPPAIGGTSAAAGAFTTLSASSTVSGTGFSTYLASPPAIGGTAAAAGTFTTGTFNTSTVHKGATSGTITIAAPAVAGTQSYTLPTALPTVSGYALTSTTGGVMSWAASGGGGGSPGGSTTQVQYNNAGAFGGISGFTTDGTRVTASTTIGVGGATPSTSGSGITFPATQSPSTDANTLDDYEEGTFTPVLRGSTSGTVNGEPGRYTKIGRYVWIDIQIEVGNGSQPVGNYTITGLPFTSRSYYNSRTPLLADLLYVTFDSTKRWSATVDSNATQITLAQNTAASASTLVTGTQFAATNSSQRYTGFYEVA